MLTLLELNVGDADRLFTGVEGVAADWGPALFRARGYLLAKMTQQVKTAGGPGGGSSRGVLWAPRAPQYTRADGTAVSAWGGVAKVRGSGVVKALKTKGGQRITERSRFFGGQPGRRLTLVALKTNDRLDITFRRDYYDDLHNLRQLLFTNGHEQQRIAEFVQQSVDERIQALEEHAQ